MKKGHIKVNCWNWRIWLFCGFCVAVLFWALLFASYFYLTLPNPGDVPPVCQTLINYIGSETIVQNFYWEIFGLLATLGFFCFFIFKQINLWINQRGLGSTVDDLLWAIPTAYDDVIIESCRKLGIEITPESTTIAPEVLDAASSDALARTLSWLLYFNYERIEGLAQRGQHTALHQLADLLLESWDQDDIFDFIQALAEEKEYLGLALEAALNRRKLELCVEDLERRIQECRERESGVYHDSPIIDGVEKRLADYQELLAGKSAAVKWSKRWLNRLKKKVIRPKAVPQN